MLDLSLQQEGFSPGLAVNQESTAAVVVCGTGEGLMSYAQPQNLAS